MKNRFFAPLVLTFALVAAACGSTADVATNEVDEAADSTEEVVEETVEDEPEASTTTEAETEPEEFTTTTGPPETEPPADQTTTPAPEEEPETTTTEAAEITTTTEAPAETTTTEAAETTTTTEAPAETTTTEAVVEEVPAITIDGQAIYESNCTRCHAADGSGGRGPSLQGIAAEQPDQSAGIAQTVNGGGGMPAFGNTLTADEIQATIDYIWDTF